MNHFKAIMDVPAEWKHYFSERTQYIADRLEGKHSSPPRMDRAIGWTIIATGLVIFYTIIFGGAVIFIYHYAPGSYWVIGTLVCIAWSFIALFGCY
jgi:hypothetical protein